MSLVNQVGDETPEMLDIILDSIRANQLELNTLLPGVITKYDPATQTASVQPSLKRTFISPEVVISRPEIDDVPVIFPRSGQQGVVFPVNRGDSVLLLFCQRSLDDWLDNGGEVQVNDSRLHNLNDAIALVGFASLADKLDPAPTNDRLELRSEKIFIGDPNQSENSTPPQQGVDVISLLDKTLTAILALTVPTAVGPSGVPINSADFTAIQQDLQKIKS